MFDGELIVFHEATGMVHRLNSGASAVWLLCDGETPVGSMADELGELFGVDPAGLAHDVRQALTQLLQGGLLVGDDAVDAGGNAASQVDLLSEAAGEPSAVRTLRRPPDP